MGSPAPPRGSSAPPRPRTLLLCGNVALYAACYTAQAPVLPFLTTSLHADLVSYGHLMTLFSVIQLVGGLLAGPLVDAYGPRVVLLASYASSALCYVMTARAGSMAALYASRLPTLLQHAVLATRAALAAASSEEERAAQMGYVGTAYGVGMLLGPTLGGHLARTNVRLASWAAAAGSLASVVSILVSLPPDARPSKPAAAAASAGGAGAGGAARPPGPRLADVWRVCCLAGMPSLLAVKALSGFASALLQSATPLFLASRFGLDARGTGLVMSFSGAVSILAQAVAVAWLCVRFSDRTVVASCALATLPCFLLLACAGSVPTLCAALAPLLLASTVLSTVNTAQITKAAASDLGSAVAVDLSVGSALRIGTPTAAAAALQGLGYASVGGISAAATALLLLLIAVGAVDAAPAAAAAAAQSVAAKLQ